jgi:hypothetical protein
MRKLLNKPWFVGGLVATALLLAVLRPGQGAGVRDASMAPPESADLPAVAVALGERAPNPVSFALEALPARTAVSDPFAVRPGQVALRTVTETIRLSGIWTQNGATLILINDRILRAGDEIGSLTVQSADQDGVWVAHAGKRDFLSLGETRSFSFAVPAAATRTL